MDLNDGALGARRASCPRGGRLRVVGGPGGARCLRSTAKGHGFVKMSCCAKAGAEMELPRGSTAKAYRARSFGRPFWTRASRSGRRCMMRTTKGMRFVKSVRCGRVKVLEGLGRARRGRRSRRRF